MSKAKKKGLPGTAARIAAALLALVMTFSLWGAQLSLLGTQALSSTALHTRAALAGDVMALQMARITAEMEKLAAQAGFSPETAEQLVPQEAVEQYDREIIAWWTGAVAAGKMETEPAFHLEGAEEKLKTDAEFSAGKEPAALNEAAEDVIWDAQEIVRKSAVLFRDTLVQAGVKMAGGRVNLPQLVQLAGRIFPLAGVMALLCAGCIALLMSRRIQTAGQYIGGAMSAVGLLMVMGLAGVKALNLREMIAEASALLEAQYAHLAGRITWEVILGAAALMVLGGLLMTLARKEYRRHESEA